MSREYVRRSVSRWLPNSEVGRATAWVRAYSVVLGRLSIPEAKMRLGETRVRQRWISPDGRDVLALLGKDVHGAKKTPYTVPEVLVHVHAMLPESATPFGISGEALKRLLQTFDSFIEANPTQAELDVPLTTFIAHLHSAVETLGVEFFMLTGEHVDLASARSLSLDASSVDILYAEDLVRQMMRHQIKLTIDAKRFLMGDRVSVREDRTKSAVRAGRLYAWATGLRLYLGPR